VFSVFDCGHSGGVRWLRCSGLGALTSFLGLLLYVWCVCVCVCVHVCVVNGGPTVQYGEGLAVKDANGYSDPYLVMGVGESRPVKTKVIKKNLSPQWNEVHIMYVKVLLTCPDRGRHSHEKLFTCSLAVVVCSPYDKVTDMVSIRCFDHDTFSSDDFMVGGLGVG
jgi:C2 domain